MTGREWYGGPLRVSGRGPKNGRAMSMAQWTAIMAKPWILGLGFEAMR